jgi:Fur family ferric uptake transcriptional regulator
MNKSSFEKDISEKFANADIRLTAQRLLIAETIWQSTDHPDADLIYRRTIQKDSSVSLATTYRTLNLLEESGIIRKLTMQDGKVRFEIERDDHNHLVDVENKKIHEFKDDRIHKLLSSIADEMGYEMQSFQLDIIGKKQGKIDCGCLQIKVY